MFSQIEFLKTEMEPLVRAVIKKFVETSKLLATMQFETIPGIAATSMRQSALPSTTQRALGEEYTHSESRLDPNVEFLKIHGGLSTFDRVQVLTGQGSRRAQEGEAFAESIALNFGRDVIKGDQESDPRNFEGLQNRLTLEQVIQAVPATGAGGALTIKQALNAKKEVSRPTHWLMSEELGNLITIAAHNTAVGGYVTKTKDQMGDEVVVFCNLPILILSHDADDQNILEFDEVSTDAGDSDTQSIYCVSLLPDRMHGIQNGPVVVQDLGQNPATGTTFNMLIEWLASFKLEHRRSASRLRDIQDLAVTLQ